MCVKLASVSLLRRQNPYVQKVRCVFSDELGYAFHDLDVEYALRMSLAAA